MPERPKKRGVRLSTSWPFVEVIEGREGKRDHATMALVTGLAAATMVLTPYGPAPVGAFFAFISGYAVHSYVIHDEYYDGGESA